MREQLFIGLVFFLGFSAMVQAQPRFDSVEFGFNGRYLPEALTPLTVSIINGNAALNAILEVTQELRPNSGWVERIRFPVSLAPRTRKKLSLDFPVRGVSAPIQLRLLYENGRELARDEIELRERWSEEPFTLALETQEIPHTEKFEYAQLPQRWSSYDSLRRIYWGRLDPAQLGDHQREALYQWVLRGGELVILGGRYALEQTGMGLHSLSRETPHGWWSALLPLNPLRIVEAEGAVHIDGEVRQGTRVVAKDSRGRPLWWERSLGLGRVFLSAIETPSEWSGLDNIDGDRAHSDEALFIERALGRERIPAPSRLWLGFIVVLFFAGVAVAGTQAVTRLKLSWVLPVWTLFVSLLLWSYLRSPDFVRHYYSLEMNLLLGWSNEPLAWEQSWYALFARRYGEQQLAVGSESVRNLTRVGQGPQGLSVTLLPSPEERQLRFYMGQDSIRSLRADRFLLKKVEFSVDPSVSPPRILVYNRSAISLEQAAVHWKGSFYILGEIRAQSEKAFTLEETTTEAAWMRDLGEPSRTLWQHARSSLPPVALVAWRTTDSSLWEERRSELRRTLSLVVIAASQGSL